jgi:replicative DNA helicase
MNEQMDLIPLEIEQLVIGQVLYSPDTIGRAARILKPDHFGDPECRKVYAAALDLWRADVAVDLMTVYMELRKRGGMENGMQVAELAGYTTRVAQTINFEDHVKILLEYFRRRTLLSASNSIASGLQGNDDTSEVDRQDDGGRGKGHDRNQRRRREWRGGGLRPDEHAKTEADLPWHGQTRRSGVPVAG